MEQKKKTIMFYEICRLCLDERGLCDIFERNGLSEDIHKCTGVKVSPADNLPQRICESCLDIVNKAKLLSILAKKNEHYLKSLFYDDEEEEKSKVTTKEVTETVTSTYFDKEKLGQEKVAAIENFLSVRTDLFESSVTEESLLTAAENQPDSSSKPDEPVIKRLKREHGQTERLKREDGQTDYKCSVCSKKFDKWKKLYLHNRLHNKNYACPLDMCGKKFSTKGDVEKHIRTHTGEKPYQCDICDKSFTQRGTLRIHKESVHSAS